jgi:DNA-binding IclR family transcriptional regulator
MQSHERLFALLRSLGEKETSTLTQLSARVGLPKPTVLRTLRSLEPGGWVTRTPEGGYTLGPSIVGLAGQYLAQDSLILRASPAMRRLRDTLAETTTLSRASGATRTCVQEFPSPQGLRLVLGLGEQGPLHAGASGLVLLAHMPDEVRAEFLARPLEALTEHTITSAATLEAECQSIRERGWSITHSQRTAGGIAMSVPIADPEAQWGIAALGVYGPEARCRTPQDEQRWLDALLECAEEITSSSGTVDHLDRAPDRPSEDVTPSGTPGP